VRKTIFLATAVLFLSHEAAAQSWSSISFTAPPQSTAALVAAAGRMLASPVGKEFPGQLLLQVNVADGDNPATHSWVPIYESAGQREAWVAKLQASAAWTEFLGTIQQLSSPGGTTQYRTTMSGGDPDPADTVWASHAFTVTDPAGFQAAVKKFLASPSGEKAPGQVYISSVVAGGLTPVNTVISVGYASEAEMESWIAVRNASPDWATYVAESRGAATFLGTSLSRTVKVWGTAPAAN